MTDRESSQSVAQHFEACLIAPQGSASVSTTSPQDTTSASHKVNSFYLDSAGRAQVSLPLQLTFASKEALNQALESGCIQPSPIPTSKKDETSTDQSADAEKGEETKDKENTTSTSGKAEDVSYLFTVEARVKMTFGTGEAISAMVENVEIESSHIQQDCDNILCLMVVANLRVARQGDIVTSVGGVKVNLEVVGVLTESQTHASMETSNVDDAVNTDMSQERHALARGLRDLYFGRYNHTATNASASSSSDASSTLQRTTTTNAKYLLTKLKLTPALLFQVSLNHAFLVEPRSMNGPIMGETWIALNISHSNAHNSPVSITNVVLHPASSKEKTSSEEQDPTKKQSNLLDDMSQNVKWRFLETMKFPITLERNEAYSTILHVKADEDVSARSFTCPISVTATLGTTDSMPGIVSIVHGEWTTAKRMVSPSDSFRVDFTLPEQDSVQIGRIFSLLLSIHNLGDERKDLKVMLSPEAPRKQESSDDTLKEAKISFHNPDMTQLFNNTSQNELEATENYLLAVDDSCLLGTVEAHESVKAELRFIPLRAGTLSLPNVALQSTADKPAQESSNSLPIYWCPHNLQVVATN